MTLRCLEPSGNGADRTRSQWGTAGSAEEQSPEAARLAKALRELSQTGRELAAGKECETGRLPQGGGESAAGTRAQVGSTESDGTSLLASGPRLRSLGPAQRDARRLGGILGGDKKQSGGTLELGRRAERELGMVSQCGDPGLLSAGVRA